MGYHKRFCARAQQDLEVQHTALNLSSNSLSKAIVLATHFGHGEKSVDGFSDVELVLACCFL